MPCHIVSSPGAQDFYNLVDVYLDAVFHPRAVRDPNVLAQEGWHYEIQDPSDPLVFKGVVFNEMKGVYSNPESVHFRAVQQALFPGTAYGQDSGGDPVAIPDLTFEQFQAFHAQYYHPSNAWFWFYGDDPAGERLRLLDQYLGAFEANPSDSRVEAVALSDTPRHVSLNYAADPSEGAERVALHFAAGWHHGGREGGAL